MRRRYKVPLTALSKLPLTVLRPALSRAVRLDTATPARAWRVAAGPRQRHRGRGRLSRRSWAGCDPKPGLPASRNVWSLHSLHECLTRRGDTIETAHIKLQLDKAVARSGVPVRASCNCHHSQNHPRHTMISILGRSPVSKGGERLSFWSRGGSQPSGSGPRL